jgi:thiamine kinase-like enzyme
MMDLANALSEHATLAEIHGMLIEGEPHKALRRELSALLSDRNTLENCHLRHVRFRPGRKLIANYEAHLRTDGTGRVSTRAVEVTWRLRRNGDSPQTIAEIEAMEDEAARRGVAAPFRQLVADFPEWCMHIQVSPVDEHFPQLVRVHDPSYVRDMVGRAYAASGESRDQDPTGSYGITSIRYRPARRHVLRYDPLGAPEQETLFAKMYAGDTGGQAFCVATQVADWLAQRGGGVRSLRPLAFLAEDGVVFYRRLSGEPLSRHLQSPTRDVVASLRSVGAALRALHEFPYTAVGPLKTHDLAAEIKLIKRSCKHYRALLPAVSASVEAMLLRAAELNELLPQEPLTFTHADFLTDHVWVTPAGLVFIDFDNACLADPALDIGKFLADLHFWYSKYGRQGVEEAQREFLAGYDTSTSPERLVRARLYEAIKLAKMVGRRVFVFEKDWASRTERLIGLAQKLMNDFEHALGLPPKQLCA